MAGIRPAERLCGRLVAAVVFLAPSYPPLPLGEGWGEGVRRAGVDRRSCGGRNLAACGPRLSQGAPKCAKVGHATPAGAPNRGRSPRRCPRWRCAVADQRTRPCRDRDRAACHNPPVIPAKAGIQRLCIPPLMVSLSNHPAEAGTSQPGRRRHRPPGRRAVTDQRTLPCRDRERSACRKRGARSGERGTGRISRYSSNLPERRYQVTYSCRTSLVAIRWLRAQQGRGKEHLTNTSVTATQGLAQEGARPLVTRRQRVIGPRSAHTPGASSLVPARTLFAGAAIPGPDEIPHQGERVQ